MPKLHWRDAEREAQRRRLNPTRRKSFSKGDLAGDVSNPAKQKAVDAETRPYSSASAEDERTEKDTSSALQTQSPPKEFERNAYVTDDTVTGPSDFEVGESGTDAEAAMVVEPSLERKRSFNLIKKISFSNIASSAESSSSESKRKERLKSVGMESYPETDDENVESRSNLFTARSEGGSSVDYDERVEIDAERDNMTDVIKCWQEKRLEQRADRVLRICSNCNLSHAAWYCHGCDYNYCNGCNHETHYGLCSNFRSTDHVLQRLDNKELKCGRCRKGIWDIFAQGYDSFHQHFREKKRIMMRKRIKEEMIPVREKVDKLRHAMKKERNGNRLREAQQDKLADMLRQGKEEVRERVADEVGALFAPVIEPIKFHPDQIVLKRDENGRPAMPPHRDETGRYIAMFSYDFERNSVLCRACSLYWNSGPSQVNKRVVLNAYAPVGPQLDPTAAARNTMRAIRRAKKNAEMLEKLKAMARKKEAPKSSMCVLL